MEKKIFYTLKQQKGVKVYGKNVGTNWKLQQENFMDM